MPTTNKSTTFQPRKILIENDSFSFEQKETKEKMLGKM